MSRLDRVVRIQFMNAPVTLGIPLIVLTVVFLANLFIFGIAGQPEPGAENSTGAVTSIYAVMLAIHLQTITQIFPFALGLGVTRRTFYGATALVILGESLAYGILLTAMGALERITGGWGMHLRFFTPPFLQMPGPVSQTAVYTVPLLLLAFLGIWVGVVFKRWGQLGIYAMGITAGVILVLLSGLVTWQEWWPSVGGFFTDRSNLALFAGYPLVLTALLAGAGYLTLRRAAP